jgi:hypothetical protein
MEGSGTVLRRTRMTTADGTGWAGVAREVVELNRAEAMRLLASIGYGRVVFTQDGLPAIRPVNHLVDHGRVIVRTRLTSTISTTVRSHNSSGVVVAYEADNLDPQRRLGGRGRDRAGDDGYRPRSDGSLRADIAAVGEHGHGHGGRDRTTDRHWRPHCCQLRISERSRLESRCEPTDLMWSAVTHFLQRRQRRRSQHLPLFSLW